MSDIHPAPVQVAHAVNHFITVAMMDVEKYENRSHYDESEQYSLHDLARTIYALGFADGHRYQLSARTVKP